MKYLQKKKLAFMSIVNAVKGFVRTVFGVPPLILPDCVDEESLVNYTIKGNSVQSVGDKTKNLANIFNVTNASGSSIEIETREGILKARLVKEISYDTFIGQLILENLKKNTDYVITGVPSTSDVSVLYVYRDYLFGSKITNCILGSSNNTFNTGENTSVVIGIYWQNLSKYAVGSQIEISNIQIEEGSTATEYEPYGYKIPVTTKGINVIDKSKSSHKGVRDGTPSTFWGAAFYMDYVKTVFKPGKTYTISYDIECIDALPEGTTVSSDKSVGINWVSRSVSMPNILSAFFIQKGEIYHFSRTFTIPDVFLSATDVQLSVYSNYAKYSDGSTAHATAILKNLIVVEGSEENDYEAYIEPITTNIYLDEPLQKADYIDFKNQKVVRNTEETPTEKLITLPKLPTVKGTTVYTVDTTVQPTNMSAIYYATSKE